MVNSAEELSAALQHGSSEYTLLGAGGDNLIGGDGDDIIFGDSVNTDALADANGLTTPNGAGWAVFQQLGWSEQQIMDYIKANHSSLSTESGRTGGNDVIDGGAGDDIIYGQEGDDIISGGSGNNILSGGSGTDTFIISNGAHDTILDYSKLEGDKVDISGILDEGAGDRLNVVSNANGSVKLEILDSSNVEKASVTFNNINYGDLGDMGSGNELDSLLNKVVIDH
jgi:Ca2+-binding RTX toxin-like protein